MSARNSMILGAPHTAVFHHTGENSSRMTTVTGVRDWHTGVPPNGNGWPDIGYHYYIDGDAQLWEGRPLHLIGYHAIPNAGRIGICIAGNNLDPEQRWTPFQICAGFRLLKHLEAVFPGLKHGGHRDVVEPGYTECPGVDVRELFALVEMARTLNWGV